MEIHTKLQIHQLKSLIEEFSLEVRDIGYS